MAKIIQIRENIIFIGLDDGSIEEVRTIDLNFVPNIGDEVEIFKTDTRVIVSKVEKVEKVEELKKQDSSTQQINREYSTNNSSSGININLNQNYGNNAYQIGGGYNQPIHNANMVGNKKVVNKSTYILLAVFLGSFGAHKFYQGKTGLGILYLIFCWSYIPTVVGLLEALYVVLDKKSDQYGNILL